MPNTIVLAAFVLTLGLALLIAIAAGGFKSEGESRLRRRLRRIERPTRTRDAPDTGVDLRRNAHDSGIPALDQLIKRIMPRPAELRRRLVRTGLKLSPGEYLLGSVLVGALGAFALREFLGAPPLLSVIAAFGLGLAVPHVLVNMLIKGRLKTFTVQFPEAIDLIVRGLKSGLPVPASMHTVADEMQDPVASEFRLITDRLRIGQSLDESLRDAADRLPTAEFRFFVISLAVQRETGGNLAETLENLAEILRKRRQMKLKIKAMSSEAKASAIILGSLPFLLSAALYALNPGYVSQLFHDVRGLLMVGVGFASLGIGILVMAKMVRFEI